MDTGDNNDFNRQETVERKKKKTQGIYKDKKIKRDDINDKKANNCICMYTYTYKTLETVRSVVGIWLLSGDDPWKQQLRSMKGKDDKRERE